MNPWADYSLNPASADGADHESRTRTTSPSDGKDTTPQDPSAEYNSDAEGDRTPDESSQDGNLEGGPPVDPAKCTRIYHPSINGTYTDIV